MPLRAAQATGGIPAQGVTAENRLCANCGAGGGIVRQRNLDLSGRRSRRRSRTTYESRLEVEVMDLRAQVARMRSEINRLRNWSQDAPTRLARKEER